MKKLMSLAFVLFGFTLVARAEIFAPFGQSYAGGTHTDVVVAVSSSAVTTSAAVASGNYREFTNTGSTDIQRFVVLASSVTANLAVIAPGSTWVEDRFMGAYYFLVPSGTASSTLNIKTFKNR